MGTPPLFRTRPPQVLLGVGAVLVVAAGAAALAAPGRAVVQAVLAGLAVAAAGGSFLGARSGLRATRETLAGCAVGLAAVTTGALDRSAGPTPAAVLAGLFLALHVLVPATRTWLLAAWGAFQVAVLHLLPQVPEALRSAVVLGVALVGLLLTFAGGRLIPRIALVTTAPWHVAGVLGDDRTAWTAGTGERWGAALLVAAAGAGLVLARLRPPLDPFLGPPRAVPVVAGLTTGIALAGAAAGFGPVGTTAAGFLGLLAAVLVPELLSGWPRGLFTPIAVAGGSAAAALGVGRLVAQGRWGALVVLLLLAALTSGLTALLRPEERGATVPATVGCLAGAVLLAVPAGGYGAATAAVLLTVVYAAALAADAALPWGDRGATEVAAAVCAAAAVVVVAVVGRPHDLAAVLAVQAALTLAWAGAFGRGTPGGARAWPAGAAELVLAAWLGVHEAGWHVLEGYTLPLAGGLLLAAGPRLLRGSSWPAWGPGLLVAAVPSAVLAVAGHGSTRAVLVLLASAAAMVGGPLLKVRTPLLVGAGTAAVVAVGLAALALPWPIAAALATGAVLLAVGARRERFPTAGFGLRLADLR